MSLREMGPQLEAKVVISFLRSIPETCVRLLNYVFMMLFIVSFSIFSDCQLNYNIRT